jgi:hypothetical protein
MSLLAIIPGRSATTMLRWLEIKPAETAPFLLR